MKNWPLRWKVAVYSASLAVAATLGGAITTWFVLRQAEIAAFDRREGQRVDADISVTAAIKFQDIELDDRMDRSDQDLSAAQRQ